MNHLLEEFENVETHLIRWLLWPLLAGCASGVKLNDVPVEDRPAPAARRRRTPGAHAEPGGTRHHRPEPGHHAGPANVARIVYFDYDSYTVKPEFQSVIDGHARFLKPTRSAASRSKATPTNAAAANTTWHSARSVPKPCAARSRCWA
jgi:outer membrane protein OmpA-like peptidoglycan-associated protein